MGWLRAVWAAIERAQKWPGLAQPALIARTLAAALMVGSAVDALVTTMAPAGVSSAAVQYSNALLAGVLGIAVLMIGDRFTLWQLNLLVLIGLAMITVAVVGAEGASAVSLATLYVFAACAAFFVTWPTAAIYLGLAAGCCLTALILAPAPWWTGAVTALITVVIGTVIAILGRMVAKAELDDATGLPNRRGFDRLILAEISRISTAGNGPAVIFISVEGLAAIQEEFGARAANTLIRQMIESWRGMLGPEQILARRGDDEFAVLLPGTGEQDALAVVELLRTKSTRDFSAGVSAWNPGESTSPAMARADTALRRARSTGRNRTMLESADLPPVAVQLRDALAADTIDVRYQPIVRLDDNDAVIGVEALLRWSPPSDPNLQAIEVIRVAEENQLISALDQCVLRRACLDARWMQEHTPQLRLILGVNVSGLELVEEGYVARVFGTLASTGWPAEQLVLEVTESVIDVDRPSSINALHKLRAHGIQIAIDDFGAGYSSLSRLQQLPTDILKLDATFTASISSISSTPPPLLLGVVGLAEALRLPVLAEGVETAHQASVLRNLGYPLAQGFYFGRAQTRDAVVATIARAMR